MQRCVHARAYSWVLACSTFGGLALKCLFIKRDSRGYMPPFRKNGWEEAMKAILSFVAVAALAISVSSTAAKAATADGVRMAQAQGHHHYWSPRKHTYGKRMRAHWGARCKMTGSC